MKYIVILFIMTLFISCSQPSATIISYPAIDSLQSSDIYNVRVNNTEIWTEKLSTKFDIEKLPDWFTGSEYVNRQQTVHINNFSCSGPINVQIKVPNNIDSVRIHPLGKNIQARIHGQSCSFQTKGPEKLYIQINDYAPLCFFANPLETDIPDSTDSNVMYFGPGVHHAGLLHPQSNTTIYIAGGAIVYGGLESDNVSNIRVIGRGILDGEFKYNRMVKPKNSSHLEFNGVMIRCGRSWTNTLINCDSVLYENVKVISFRPGGDGINPLNSRHVRINNCFLRCTDDCIAIKAPNPEISSYDIRVSNNTMVGFAYSDGCTIGFETNGPRISDILVENCDIIQARGGSRVDGHSAFSIICDGPASIENIRYKNIRAEMDVLKLFELHITDGSLYGIDPPGHIQNIHLENIQWQSIRPIVLHGLDADHIIKNVTFENCTVNGELLTTAREDIFQVNAFVENVKFE